MKLAKDFLLKFQTLAPPDEAVRVVVARIIREVAGHAITKKDVSISRGAAFVDCSSVAKSAIRVVRAEILRELYAELPKAREIVRDIR